MNAAKRSRRWVGSVLLRHPFLARYAARFGLLQALSLSIFIHTLPFLLSGQSYSPQSGADTTQTKAEQSTNKATLKARLAPTTSESIAPAIPEDAESTPQPPTALSDSTQANSSEGNGSPRFATELTPYYPIHLIATGIRGSVTVKFTINEQGSPEDMEILDSNPPGAFDVAALDALANCRFIHGSFAPHHPLTISIQFTPEGLSKDHRISPLNQ